MYFEAGPEVASSGFSFLGWRCGCFSYDKFFFAPRGILPHVLRSRSVMTWGEKNFFFEAGPEVTSLVMV